MSNEKPIEEEIEEIELILEPVPPDTPDSIREEFESVVRRALREAGREDLLDSGQIRFKVEENFPGAEILIPITIAVVSGIAVKVFEVTVLPEIKKFWTTQIKKRQKRRKNT